MHISDTGALQRLAESLVAAGSNLGWPGQGENMGRVIVGQADPQQSPAETSRYKQVLQNGRGEVYENTK